MLYPCPLIMGDRGMFVTRFCFSLQLCRISYINVLCSTNDVTVAIGPCLSAVTTLLADGVGCKASPSYLLLVAWPASEQLSPLLLPHRTPFGIECEVVADTKLNPHKAEDLQNHFTVVMGNPAHIAATF